MRIASGITDQYTCSKCSVAKEADQFGIDRHQARGLKYACKECINSKRRGRYQEENRGWYLKSKYGITPKDYLAMTKEQDNTCAICKEVPEQRKGGGRAMPSIRLFIDHCHETSKVRGLLCHRCNLGLGLMRDNIQYLRAAANYLEEVA